MVKYIFYMLLGLFLISKVVSVSGDIEECETLHAIVDTQHHPEKWHTLSEKFLNHYEAGIQCESYDNQTDDVSIGNNFSFHCQNCEVSEDFASRRKNNLLFIQYQSIQFLL